MQISLFTKKIRLPNGNSVTLELIEHPGAVLIIPFKNRDKIILLRQFRPVINSYLYELPAGTLKKGERPQACARREIKEETGFAAGKINRLGIIYPVPGYSTEKITIFKAEKLDKVDSSPEYDEVISTMIVTKGKVKRLFNTGKITDAKTISAFAMCGWL